MSGRIYKQHKWLMKNAAAQIYVGIFLHHANLNIVSCIIYLAGTETVCHKPVKTYCIDLHLS